MVDIIPYVKNLLTPLNAQIEQSYRDTHVTFPLIVIQVIGDSAETARDGAEAYTRMTLQVDAYTLDKDDTYALAKSINNILTPNGFRRTNGFPATEGELERYQMTYSVGVDYQNKTNL